MEKIPYLGKELMRWQVGRSTFLALPEMGARLMNWNVELGDGSLRDVLHWPEVASLTDFHRIRGGNPILFPFAGRCFDGGEAAFWRGPDGVRRPMPTHGLARQGKFRTVRADAGGFAALFVPDDEARGCYPFDYEFTVDYRFEPLGFFAEFALRNLGRTPLPWSAGHHFYFSVPWSDGRTRADYTVRIPAARVVRQDMNTTGMLVEQPPLQPEEPLTNPALSDLIHLGLKTNAAVLAERGGSAITLRVGTEKKPAPGTAILTWTEKTDSPFYCVEPWMGPPNAPGHKTGLHLVEPGQVQRFVVEVSLR